MQNLIEQTPAFIILSPMDRETLIFLHIPKTAGTTLNRIIKWRSRPFEIFTIDPYGSKRTTGTTRKTSRGAPPPVAGGARTYALWCS